MPVVEREQVKLLVFYRFNGRLFTVRPAKLFVTMPTLGNGSGWAFRFTMNLHWCLTVFKLRNIGHANRSLSRLARHWKKSDSSIGLLIFKKTAWQSIKSKFYIMCKDNRVTKKRWTFFIPGVSCTRRTQCMPPGSSLRISLLEAYLWDSLPFRLEIFGNTFEYIHYPMQIYTYISFRLIKFRESLLKQTTK